MSLWERLLGRKKLTEVEEVVLRDIPESALTSAQTLRCDPQAAEEDRRFSIGKWGLRVVGDEESQRLAKGVLKRSAGKTLRLESHAEGGHRGVISSKQGVEQGSGYRWITVEVDLRAGTISFAHGGSGDWQ